MTLRNSFFKIQFFAFFSFFFCATLHLSCTNHPTPTIIEKKDGMVLIPSGTLNMGGDNDQADPNEFPKHTVEIQTLWMDEAEVTNHQFKDFVEATKYLTIAGET